MNDNDVSNIVYPLHFVNTEQVYESREYYSEGHRNKRRKTTHNVNVFNDILHTNLIPEDFIICEIHERLFCGPHALRALVQNRNVFDDFYLRNLGDELATAELLVCEDNIRTRHFYYNIVNGYYNIVIIQEALRRQYNIELIQLH